MVKERHKHEGASPKFSQTVENRTIGEKNLSGSDKDRKLLGTLDARTHAQHACRLGRNGLVVTSDHLHLFICSESDPVKRPLETGCIERRWVAASPPPRKGKPALSCALCRGGEGPGRSEYQGTSTDHPHYLGAQRPESGFRACQARAPAHQQTQCDSQSKQMTTVTVPWRRLEL